MHQLDPDNLPPNHIIEEWLEREKLRREAPRPRLELPLGPPAPYAPPATGGHGRDQVDKDSADRGVETFSMV